MSYSNEEKRDPKRLVRDLTEISIPASKENIKLGSFPNICLPTYTSINFIIKVYLFLDQKKVCRKSLTNESADVAVCNDIHLPMPMVEPRLPHGILSLLCSRYHDAGNSFSVARLRNNFHTRQLDP
ncbi:hypothetical protein ABEB36_007521 [Hypothenemus hampei]|uniref:Uncharacterized protein n=1 Tax=Hypothenemus hampei TaxID=57062 RepID=A0ABD1EUB5_HYPHA